VRPGERLRAVMEHAPRAEALLTRWVERTRPAWSWLLREWRQLGTGAAALLIVSILVHAIFGANGMMIYRQKHDEMRALQTEVDGLQKENEAEAERIKQLKSNPSAIEKEAREQLHYSRKGEVVFVAPDSPKKPASVRPKNAK
jgi:cell division protein FtsB